MQRQLMKGRCYQICLDCNEVFSSDTLTNLSPAKILRVLPKNDLTLSYQVRLSYWLSLIQPSAKPLEIKSMIFT